MASGSSLFELLPLGSETPAANFATLDTRNARPCIDFDAATNESIVWTDTIPAQYAGGGITFKLRWAATSATTGNVVWVIAIERTDDEGLDIDSDSFATGVSVTATCPGTSGQVQYTDIALTNSELDGALVGELIRVKLTRNAADGSDTMAGDAECIGVYPVET